MPSSNERRAVSFLINVSRCPVSPWGGTKPPNARSHAAEGGLIATLNALAPVANGRSRTDSSLRPSEVVMFTSSELKFSCCARNWSIDGPPGRPS